MTTCRALSAGGGALIHGATSMLRKPVAPPQQQPPPGAGRTLIENIKAMASPAPSASKAAAQSQGRIILNGIMSQDGHHVALIDGQVYEEGENIDGTKIIKINASSIVVSENGVERTIKVMWR